MAAEMQNAMALGGVGEEAEEEEEEEEHDLDVCAEIDIPSAKEGCKLAFAVDSEESKIQFVQVPEEVIEGLKADAEEDEE